MNSTAKFFFSFIIKLTKDFTPFRLVYPERVPFICGLPDAKDDLEANDSLRIISSGVQAAVPALSLRSSFLHRYRTEDRRIKTPADEDLLKDLLSPPVHGVLYELNLEI